MHFNIKNILNNNDYNIHENGQIIYLSLYNSIKKAIDSGSLDEPMKLPPSRVLAKDLGISRSTVMKAYDLLILEKHLKSVTGSGYFVVRNQTQHNLPIPNTIQGGYPKLSKIGKSFKEGIQLKTKGLQNGIAFRPGLPPLDIFPVRQWQKLSNEYWRTIRYSDLSYSSPTGIQSLKENILNYLKIYRNIHCDVDQIIITSGSLHSLFLVSNALLNAKDEVVIENPTYPYAYRLFKSLNARIHSVNVDEEGICIDDSLCRKPKLVYTTPSNQHPTGIKMSLKRRVALLKWASKRSSFIVEDDYDHEFSNWENPISPIYSLDDQDRVIYLGSFNKILHPSIRLGYMIVPNNLIDVITVMFEYSNRFVPPSLQKTLSAFIEKDYLNRHLRNTMEISAERKKVFHDNFSSSFHNEILLDSNNMGLNVIGHLKKGIDDQKLAEFFNNIGVITYPLSNYYNEGIKKNGLVMGYSSVNNKRIKDTIYKMATEYQRFLNLKH